MTNSRLTERLVWLLAIMLAGTSISCTQLLGGKAKIRERRQFIIESDPLHLSLPLSERPYEFRVKLEKFAVSKFYQRNQIVYRLASPAEVRFDRDNIWAVRPSDMITDAVQSYLREALLFTDVRQEFLDGAPDFTLLGSVRSIERFDSGDRWFVRLDVTMQLVNRHNKIFWQWDFDPVEEEVFDPDPVFSVQAMRGLLRYNMERAIHDLDRAMLLDKLQSEGRDITFLLNAGKGESLTDTLTITDNDAKVPRSTKDYIILPGRRVPQEEGQ